MCCLFCPNTCHFCTNSFILSLVELEAVFFMRFKADTEVQQGDKIKPAMTLSENFLLTKSDNSGYIFVHKPTALLVGYPKGFQLKIAKDLLQKLEALDIDWSQSDKNYYKNLGSELTRKVFEVFYY